MSAATNVFGIPELLDMILEHAPTRDLLLQQRTNKSWQATIPRSIPMQKKWFLKPTTDPPNGNARKTFLGSQIEWNPFLAKISTPPDRNTGDIHCCDFNSTQLNLDSRYNASWQQMLVSSPPSSIVYLGRYGGLSWSKKISPPEGEAGVRMEQIVEALKKRDYVGVLGRAEHEASYQIVVRQRDVEDFSRAAKSRT